MENNNSTLQDQETDLVARLRQGDTAALEQLYKRHVDRVYSLVFHQVGQNKSVAEEIVQETFLSALKSIGKFRGKSKLHTWLCSIAYHKIADFYRREGRQNKGGEQPLSMGAAGLEQIRDSEPLASSRIEAEEDRQVVEQAILSLSLPYRQVLMLKYIEEMPVLQISQVMRRSPKSIEGLLARARKTLRAGLGEVDEG